MCYFVKYNEISIAKINQISCILFSDVLQIAQQDIKAGKGAPALSSFPPHSHHFDREIKKTTFCKFILFIYPYFS